MAVQVATPATMAAMAEGVIESLKDFEVLHEPEEGTVIDKK